MVELTADAMLGNRYRLTRRIAIGGMGEVWRAEDTVLSRPVAVKVLKSELTSDPSFLERFRAEARSTAALSHSGVANVFDYGEAPLEDIAGMAMPFLVMELVEGEPLSAILAREGRLPVGRVLDIVRQSAAALEAAHRIGMVHRDVKPGNLLVAPDGVVKVTDFGIASATDSVPLTQRGMVVGTAQYFSPEQAEGRPVTATSDVYSLGVVGYECLAGRLPFVADSPVTVAMMQIRDLPPPLPPDVPVPVQALIARAMAKDPLQRFHTGGELAEAARAALEGRYEDPTMVVGPLPVSLRSTQVMPAPAPVPTPAPQPNQAAIPAPPSPAPPLAPSAPSSLAPSPSPVSQQRIRWPLWAALATLLVVGGVATVVALAPRSTGGSGSTDGGPSSSPARSSAGTSTAPVVVLDPSEYVGKSQEKAVEKLRQLGLEPVVLMDPNAQGKPGTVAQISPEGPVTPHMKITVVVVPRKDHGNNQND